MQDMPQVARKSEVTRNRVPAWAAAVGALLVLLAAGVFIYWFLGGTFHGTTDLIPDPAHAERSASSRGGWRHRANPDGIKALSNGRGHYVRAGSAFMDVNPPPPGKKRPVIYRFRYDSRALLTPEQWHLAVGLRRVGQDALMAKTLAVTQDQLDRLRRFGTISMELSKDDREKLVAAWAEYDKAKSKADVEKKLVALLKQAGDKALPATKEKAARRVADITKLLSPEQVRELTKLGAGQTITPLAGTTGR